MSLVPLGSLASGQDTALGRSVSLTFAAGAAAGNLCLLFVGNDLTSTEASTVADPWGNTWTKHWTTTTGGHATLYRSVLANPIPAGGSWTWPSAARAVDVQGFTGLAVPVPLNTPPADVAIVPSATQAMEWAASTEIFFPTHTPTALGGAGTPGSVNGYGFGITDAASYLVAYVLWCANPQTSTFPTLTLPAGFTQGNFIQNPGAGRTTIFALQTAYRLVTGPIAAPGITCAGGTITYDGWTTEQHGIALIGAPDPDAGGGTTPGTQVGPLPPTGEGSSPPPGGSSTSTDGGACDCSGGVSTSSAGGTCASTGGVSAPIPGAV